MKGKKLFAGILAGFMAVLVIALAVGNGIALKYQTIITRSLGHTTSETVNVDESGASDYYTSAYDSYDALYAYEVELTKQIEAEGLVLLENEDNALPLASGANVSLFSLFSVNFRYGAGAGSSGAIDSSKAPTMKEAFEAAGFNVNDALWSFYEGKSSEKQEIAVSEFTSSVTDSFANYSDAAVVVFSRKGQEAQDLKEEDMSPTETELELFDYVNKNFDTVIVLVNAANAIELGWTENYENIKAVMWVGFPGQEGLWSVPLALSGAVNPSGRLVDTYAYSAESSPAMSNFTFGTVTNGINSVTAKNKYTVYGEGIYVGYRYYETRYEDVILGAGGANGTTGSIDGAAWDYTKEVQYPFGYGLSYTTFEYSNFNVTENDESFTVTVDVTNTGSAAGKEVVEVYFQSPYTDYDKENKIEKASVELCGFAKTQILEAGATETVTVEVAKEELRTYDSYGAGTYILDAGDYYVTIGTDSHTALNNILAAKGYTTANGMDADGDEAMTYKYTVAELDTTTYSVDSTTGTEIVNQFDNGSLSYYDESYVYLTRSDWEGTWPEPYGELNEKGKYEITASDALYHDSQENLYEANASDVMPTTGSGEGLKLITMRGKDYDDPAWEDILDCLTIDEMVSMVRFGGWQTVQMVSISKPASADQDGPAGISDTLIGTSLGLMGYPIEVVLASTWNVELAEEMGECVGEDGLAAGVEGWYAPGAGTHRTPYGGRNFEYYSEDGFLSGQMAAKECEGVIGKGMYVYLKHMVLNDQEEWRYGVATFCTEQALRELYLTPFEVAVKEGGCNGIMAAFNGIGGIWCGANKGLMREVLRNEWGFHGIVITDYASANSGYLWVDMGLQAGTNMWLNTDSSVYDMSEMIKDPTIVNLLREDAHEVLYTVVNSTAMNGFSEETEIRTILPLWQWWLIAADAVVVLLAAAAFIFAAKTFKKAKQASVTVVEETKGEKK